jgi:hypothetical protein
VFRAQESFDNANTKDVLREALSFFGWLFLYSNFTLKFLCCVIIYLCLFNDTVNNLDYIVSTDWMDD